MNSLTRKQKEVLTFLVHNQTSFDHPPSLAELCNALGLKSRGSLHKIVQALVENGFVEPTGLKSPGIRLTDKATTRVHPASPNLVRYVGYIAAGKPIEAIEDEQYLAVPDEIKTDKSCYVLRVKGDSMIEEGILDGDYVVIEQRCVARNGEIVVALVDKSEATLKFIEQYPHETLLIPANSAMQALRYHPSQIEIQGVLVGQMRSYRQPKTS